MKVRQILIAVSVFILISACGQSDHKLALYDETAETSPVFESEVIPIETASEAAPIDYISSSAATISNTDSARKFIRTAELKFKVKNVIQSTYDIEAIAVKHNGFVTLSNLTNRTGYTTYTAVSADSTLETKRFTMVNSLVLRVPQSKLDTVLKEISRNIDFLDYRIIKADDVALSILSNRLSQRRNQRTEQRITQATDSNGGKLKEVISAEEVALRKQEQADKAMLANLELNDRINYSTINIEIYQREDIKREVISNYKNIDEYKPGFGEKLINAAKFGWEILEAIILLVVNLWGIFLIALIAVLVIRYYIKYKNNKKQQ